MKNKIHRGRYLMDKKRRRVICKKGNHKTAGEDNLTSGGHYFCDYSPRYQEKYNIYEKAKMHMKSRAGDEKKP